MGLKVLYCPVVRCELLLEKGTSVSSRTEKLIEGDTKYVYMDILPNYINNLDVAGDCGALTCKLLSNCDPNQEIISSNILITADFKI
jgi:hypothetical protein